MKITFQYCVTKKTSYFMVTDLKSSNPFQMREYILKKLLKIPWTEDRITVMFIAVPDEIKELVVDVSPNHWRVQAITLQAPGNRLLIINSYFPNDPKTSEFDTSELLTTLSAISSVMEGNEFTNIIWTGDINADFIQHTQFTSIIDNFIEENSWQKSRDKFAIHFIHLFDIDGHSHTSTLDHFFWARTSQIIFWKPMFCRIPLLPKPKAYWKKLLTSKKSILRLIWRMISLIWRFQ